MIQQLGPLLIDQGLSIVSIEWLHVILSQNIQHVWVYFSSSTSFSWTSSSWRSICKSEKMPLQILNLAFFQLASLVPQSLPYNVFYRRVHRVRHHVIFKPSVNGGLLTVSRLVLLLMKPFIVRLLRQLQCSTVPNKRVGKGVFWSFLILSSIWSYQSGVPS